MKFFLEENLAKLARWLRFLGYQAYTIKGEVSLSKISPDAVFVTTSRRWHDRLKKLRMPVVLVPRHDFHAQLRTLLITLSLKPELKLNVCAHCNTPLKKLKKEEVKGLVPEGVYREGSDFTICPSCGSLFWRGTHTKRMEETLKKLIHER
ncbi:MAG: hypothetical protein GXO04_02730 [Aquificae bacterium]|nr:hypothetical protein [Aquificota bacterium]